MNTQGEETEFRRFPKLESRSTGRGLKYEHNMCSLVFARTTKLKYKFSLASNIEGCGAFDDVVLQFTKHDNKKKCFFVQMKSKANTTIGFSSLVSTSEKRSDFSLLKYYDSYLKIKENFKSEENKNTPFDGKFDDILFVLYTNSDVTYELKNMLSDQTRKNDLLDDANEILLTNKQNGGSVLQLKLEGKLCDEIVKKKTTEQQKKKAEKQKSSKKGDKSIDGNNVDDPTKEDDVEGNENQEEIKEQVKEFLTKLVIIYKQTEEEHFEEVVKEELRHHLQLPDEESQLAHKKYQQIFEDWWQQDYFLDSWKKYNPLTEVYDSVKSEFACQFVKHRKTDMENKNITFEDSALKSIDNILNENATLLMYSPGDAVLTTLAKINHLLSHKENHAILDFKDLVQKLDYILIAWKRGKFDILVVNVCEIHERLNTALSQVQRIVKDDSTKTKKVIFVSVFGKHMNHVKIIRNLFKDTLKVSQDTLRYSELSAATRKLLLERSVHFQGEEVTVSQLINDTDLAILDDLDEHSISMLLSNAVPVIGSDLEETLKYYIERKLEVTRTLSKKILEEKDIIFAVDIETSEKLGLSAVFLDDWLSGSMLNFVLVEKYSHFEELCKVAKNVIWLVTDKDILVWKQCKGCLDVIRRHIISHDVSQSKPMTILDGDDRIILLTAEPGMGKSSLLTYLAKMTKKEYPGMWVVRININNFTKILEDIKTQGFCEDNAIKMLEIAAGIKDAKGKSLEAGLFKKSFVYDGNMAILIDGIDEVTPSYTSQVLEIVRYFYDIEVRKIWLTSRIFMKNSLEEEFGIPSYTIVPFNKEEQELFLVKFWISRHPDADEEVLKRLAGNVRRLIAAQFKDHETDFMGIPIQSALLAEISGSFSDPTIENINLYTLYELYVEKKWEIYLREKMNADITNVTLNQDTFALYKNFINNHKAAAVVSFLKDDVLEEISSSALINQANAFVRSVQEGTEKTGIIYSINDTGHAQFMHRTFCEYFVSLWVFDNLRSNRPLHSNHDETLNFDIQSKFENIEPVLRRIFDDEFKVVKAIFERMLAKGSVIHSAILNDNESDFKKEIENHDSAFVEDFGGRTPLHVAASSGKLKFAAMLLDRGADESQHDALLGISSVSYAVKAQHWSIVSEILERRPEARDRELDSKALGNVPFMMAMLRCAQQHSHTDLIKYFSEEKGWILLHAGARAGHIEFTELVLSIGTSVNVRNPEGRTALHISSQNNDFSLARLLIMKGCTVNMADNCGNSALHVAVQTQSHGIIQLLLHNAADINAKDNAGLTSLHVASGTGDLETVNILLNGGSEVNSTDNNGYTSLHLASQHGHHSVCELLVNRGASVDIPAADGSSPLHLASVRGHSSTVEVLLNLKAVVNAINKNGQSALHVASEQGHVNVVRMLINNAASVNMKDNSGTTALQLATRQGHVAVRELLISHGAVEEVVTQIEEKKEEDDQSKLERETVRIARQVQNESERFFKKVKKLF